MTSGGAPAELVFGEFHTPYNEYIAVNAVSHEIVSDSDMVSDSSPDMLYGFCETPEGQTSEDLVFDDETEESVACERILTIYETVYETLVSRNGKDVGIECSLDCLVDSTDGESQTCEPLMTVSAIQTFVEQCDKATAALTYDTIEVGAQCEAGAVTDGSAQTSPEVDTQETQKGTPTFSLLDSEAQCGPSFSEFADSSDQVDVGQLSEDKSVQMEIRSCDQSSQVIYETTEGSTQHHLEVTDQSIEAEIKPDTACNETQYEPVGTNDSEAQADIPLPSEAKYIQASCELVDSTSQSSVPVADASSQSTPEVNSQACAADIRPQTESVQCQNDSPTLVDVAIVADIRNPTSDSMNQANIRPESSSSASQSDSLVIEDKEVQVDISSDTLTAAILQSVVDKLNTEPETTSSSCQSDSGPLTLSRSSQSAALHTSSVCLTADIKPESTVSETQTEVEEEVDIWTPGLVCVDMEETEDPNISWGSMGLVRAEMDSPEFSTPSPASVETGTQWEDEEMFYDTRSPSSEIQVNMVSKSICYHFYGLLFLIPCCYLIG